MQSGAIIFLLSAHASGAFAKVFVVLLHLIVESQGG